MADGSISVKKPIGFVLTTVTPQMAEKWLASKHEDQRVISPYRVQAIANDITAGNWTLTHQAIAFDGAGRLIDGQHRLSAVVLADKPVPMYVAQNEAASIHDPIDRGTPRPVAFVAKLPPKVAAMCAVLYRMERGKLVSGPPITVAEIMATQAHHVKAIEEVVEILGTRANAGVGAAAVWTVPIDRDATLDFLRKVRDGEMLRKGDPAYGLRQWLSGNKRMSSNATALATLGCLRAHIQGAEHKSVYVAEMGYRASCGKRRALGVPHTPGTDVVVGISWPIQDRE